MKKLILLLAAAIIVFAGCGEKQDEITVEKAKEIALSHAGLSADSATFIKAEREREDARVVYDVEFYSKENKEFDYEIDAHTGEIISYDTDVENYVPNVQSDQGAESTASPVLTETQIKAVALEKVPGATEENIREFRKERDNGRDEYEGKIIYNNTEYEFEIDAETGRIIKWEAESVFD